MKAPGEDVFSAHNLWPILKDDFIHDCLSFLNSGILHDETNTTLITLIPKQKEVSKVTDYRPISLIGMKMKVDCRQASNSLGQGDSRQDMWQNQKLEIYDSVTGRRKERNSLDQCRQTQEVERRWRAWLL
ncbi:unnamed protein product [Rhodiola kirilowii]